MTSGHGASPEVSQLDELAAVTSEYAKYSRTNHGIGLVVFGPSFLAVGATDLLFAARELRFAYLVLPTVWLFALHFSRSRYQRHGVVVATERPFSPRSRRWIIGLLTTLAGLQVSTLVMMAAITASRQPERALAAVIGGAGVAFVICWGPVLTVAVARGRADLFSTLVFTAVPWGIATGLATPTLGTPAPELVLMHRGLIAAASVLALGIIGDGIRQHVRCLGLERRLAALRSPAT